MTEGQTFNSVWDALEDSPGAAANMRLRSDLMIALHDAIDHWRETPASTAARLGIDAARLDDLQRGRISRFSLDELVGLAERANVRIEVKAAE